MCKHGTLTKINIIRRANPSIEDGWHERHVDSCIAEEVQELNNKGIITTNSCCGHGKGKGNILIARESVSDIKKLGYKVKKNKNHEDSVEPKL